MERRPLLGLQSSTTATEPYLPDGRIDLNLRILSRVASLGNVRIHSLLFLAYRLRFKLLNYQSFRLERPGKALGHKVSHPRGIGRI